jgi:nitronate monooxygenase
MLAKATSILKVPVIASGASATGRQLAAALAMGACGVTMATRFLATVECPIRQEIKDVLADPAMDERNTTVVMGPLNNATRVFKNDVADLINETLNSAEEVGFGEIAEYATGQRTRVMWQETGAWNDAMWSCGQSVGLITDIPTCKDLLARMVKEAEEQLTKGSAQVVKSKL